MNKLELFSGIGGFTKGFEEAGYKFDNVYFSELDKHAIANYKYNNPNAKHNATRCLVMLLVFL